MLLVSFPILANCMTASWELIWELSLGASVVAFIWGTLFLIADMPPIE